MTRIPSIPAQRAKHCGAGRRGGASAPPYSAGLSAARRTRGGRRVAHEYTRARRAGAGVRHLPAQPRGIYCLKLLKLELIAPVKQRRGLNSQQRRNRVAMQQAVREALGAGGGLQRR